MHPDGMLASARTAFWLTRIIMIHAGISLGSVMEGIFGGEDHFNADGSFAGFSDEGVFGGTDTFLTDDTDFFDP